MSKKFRNTLMQSEDVRFLRYILGSLWVIIFILVQILIYLGVSEYREHHRIPVKEYNYEQYYSD